MSAGCVKCGFPLREQRVPIALAPGTRTRVAGGQCSACHGGYRKPKPTVDEATDLRLAAVALEGWTAERRARISRKASK